jgi:Putative stress-induced transcription regulator
MDRLIDAQRIADFVNTEDLRRPERREPPFAAADTMATSEELGDWLRAHGRATGAPVRADELELAHRLRAALRGAIERGPRDEASARVHDLALDLPLALGLDEAGRPRGG